MSMEMDAQLEARLALVRRQYFQLVEPSLISLPAKEVLKSAKVQSWLFQQLFDEEQVQYLPPPRYQLRLLKRITRLIEQAITDPEEDEISDSLMATLARLMGASLPSEAEAAQEKAFVTYNFTSSSSSSDNACPSIDRPVTLLESRAVISGSGTTGLRTWEAALHLGAYLTTREGQAYVKDKTIMELGAGTGLVSILAAKHLGAKRVVATDGVEIVVDAIRDNLFLNGLDDSGRIEAAALKWGSPSAMGAMGEDYAVAELDVVVGADVSVIPALVSTIGRLMEWRPELQVLMAATIRNEATFEAFVTACMYHQPTRMLASPTVLLITKHRIGKRGFGLGEINFVAATEQQQQGPFYSTAVGLRILHISAAAALSAGDQGMQL
ncbi:hypothetical protein EJ05DRAFT_534728 [Pseudovirgaria hyperparasitica]|uniref:S-adenosyl-L-methionine-dependent methyltransferase n=1 Tax=Pseudovirgaria hyperparasitica TaxID=470096 RepID=A0A6A6WMD7_9PEZI|nr:uncharacterized protein EJ05DRAFT_534728 [Pseudovirgaria hyperparasitica]KAF2763371.1 hypothetical protein EJ05DRAFT_534728 [Pseudovirgaria hyperparasitica]